MCPSTSDYDPEGTLDELVSAPAYTPVIRSVEDELMLEKAKYKIQELARANKFKRKQVEFKREQEARTKKL